MTVGSRHEPAAVAGASHFLEHLLFKGTERLDAATIAESLDRVGGQSNAYTARELTCFWVRLLGEDLDVGLSILGDIVTDPALRASDVDAERTVIEDEILGSHDDPASVASERFFELRLRRAPARARPARHARRRCARISARRRPRVLLAPLRRGEPRRRRGGRRRPRRRGARRRRRGRPSARRRAATGDAAAGRGTARREVVHAPFEQAQVVIGVPIPPRARPAARRVPRLRPAARRRALVAAVHLDPRARGPRVPGVLRARPVHRRGRPVRRGRHRPRARRARRSSSSRARSTTSPGGGTTQREVDVARQALRADALLGEEDSGQVMSRIGGDRRARRRGPRPSTTCSTGVAAVTRDDVEAVARARRVRAAHARPRRPLRRRRRRGSVRLEGAGWR